MVSSGVGNRRRGRYGGVAVLFAVMPVLLAGCAGNVQGTAVPQSDGTATPSEGTAAPSESTSAPPTTDVTSSKDLRDVDDSTDIDPCSLMPMQQLKRAGEFTDPESQGGSCVSSERSIGAQVAIEFTRDTLPELIQRFGLELGNIHGRAAVEFDMSDQDLGCQVIMEMNPEEVVRVLFDGSGGQECEYAASVATVVETRISQG